MASAATSSAPTWAPPVVAEPPPRYFLVSEAECAWEELTDDPNSEAFAEKLGDGRNLVTVYTLGPNKYRIVCECYYWSEGVCSLTITQPLGRALATFNALLVADGEAEGDCLAPIDLR